MPPGGTDQQFEELLEEAEAQSFSGWDFSWLGDRMVSEPLPWNYEELVARHARSSADLLDMGTGGGERLAKLSPRPARTVATESWQPNVDVASRRLRPLGITVVSTEPAPDNVDQASDTTRRRLPFPRESFDLVVNRHESFLASEVARVLVPRGHFVTEQLGGNYADFYQFLGLAPPRRRREWDLDAAHIQLEAAGLKITGSGEGQERLSFRDVGAWPGTSRPSRGRSRGSRSASTVNTSPSSTYRS